MTEYFLEMFGVSLALTLIIETAVCWFMGMRTGKELRLVILVNVLTNPAAVLACWLGAPQLPVELAVALTEAWIYVWFSRDSEWMIRHPVRMAVLANGLSWLFGLLFGGML